MLQARLQGLGGGFDDELAAVQHRPHLAGGGRPSVTDRAVTLRRAESQPPGILSLPGPATARPASPSYSRLSPGKPSAHQRRLAIRFSETWTDAMSRAMRGTASRPRTTSLSRRCTSRRHDTVSARVAAGASEARGDWRRMHESGGWTWLR